MEWKEKKNKWLMEESKRSTSNVCMDCYLNRKRQTLAGREHTRFQGEKKHESKKI